MVGTDVDIVAGVERADAGVLIAVVGNVDHQLRRLAAHERVGRLDAAALGTVGQQPVQDRRVRRVDAAFQRLQPIALLDHLGDVAIGFRRLRPSEFRQRRDLLGRAHIRPHDAAQLAGRIRGDADLVLEVVFLRLVHHVDAGAGHVELPAVIDAAQAAFLVASEIERDATMRAELLDQADAALGVAERDQVLAEQAGARRRAVGFGDLAREQRGDPIPAHGVAHRGALSHPGDKFVLFA